MHYLVEVNNYANFLHTTRSRKSGNIVGKTFASSRIENLALAQKITVSSLQATNTININGSMLSKQFTHRQKHDLH